MALREPQPMVEKTAAAGSAVQPVVHGPGRRRRRRRGFSLLEAMVSGVLLIIGLTSVVSTIASAMEGSRRTRQSALASQIARDLVEEQLLLLTGSGGTFTRHFDGRGSSLAGSSGAVYSATVATVPVSGLPTILRVEVKVSWGVAGKLTLVTLRT